MKRSCSTSELRALTCVCPEKCEAVFRETHAPETGGPGGSRTRVLVVNSDVVPPAFVASVLLARVFDEIVPATRDMFARRHIPEM